MKVKRTFQKLVFPRRGLTDDGGDDELVVTDYASSLPKEKRKSMDPYGSFMPKSSIEMDAMAAISELESGDGESSWGSGVEGAQEGEMRVLWAIVLCIAAIQTIDHFMSIWEDFRFPISVTVSWVLVGFMVGLEIDPKELMLALRVNVLGLEEPEQSSRAPLELEDLEDATESTSLVGKRKSENHWKGVIRRYKTKAKDRKKQIFSVLQKNKKAKISRRASTVDPSAKLMRKLSEAMEPTDNDASQQSKGKLGSIQKENVIATNLLPKMQTQPICELLGMDCFVTSDAEMVMGTHPFLLQNGLRSVPTIAINVMTKFGTILVYFEMPSWVTDFDDCMVEKDDDPDNIKAFKRWMTGDDDYRKNRLKAIPQFNEAPYVVRMLESKDPMTKTHWDNWLDNYYHHHTEDNGVNENNSPLLEITWDCIANSSVRGLTGLVKGYMKKISIDIALVICKPNGQVEDEPECVLGLWRIDKLDMTAYPELPDRFSVAGGGRDRANMLRASALIMAGQ